MLTGRYTLVSLCLCSVSVSLCLCLCLSPPPPHPPTHYTYQPLDYFYNGLFFRELSPAMITLSSSAESMSAVRSPRQQACCSRFLPASRRLFTASQTNRESDKRRLEIIPRARQVPSDSFLPENFRQKRYGRRYYWQLCYRHFRSCSFFSHY